MIQKTQLIRRYERFTFHNQSSGEKDSGDTNYSGRGKDSQNITNHAGKKIQRI